MNEINVICFWVCIVCLFVGLVLSILAVWGAVSGEVVWKTLTTFALIFGASLGTAGVYSFFYPKTAHTTPVDQDKQDQGAR